MKSKHNQMSFLNRLTNMRYRYFAFPFFFVLLFISNLSYAHNNNSHEVNMYQQTTPSSNSILHAINPIHLNIPNVSQAIVVQQGQLMYLSGHVPITEQGEILQADLEKQLHLAFQNIEKTLHQAGIGTQHLVKLTIYIRDLKPDQLLMIRKVRDKFIDPQLPPASSLIGVAQLFHPDVLVEVEAVAVIPANLNLTI